MKDTFLKWLAFTLFLGLCALYSCNEEQWVDYRIGQRKSKHRNEDLTIAKAQQWYEEHYAPVVTARSSFTDADNHVKMKPGWDKAKESNRRRYEVVEVPIMTQKPHLLMDAETQKRWNPDVPEKFIRNTAKIVIERDKKTGRTRSFVMIFVGSYDYLKNTHSMGKNSYLYRQPDFDGMVLFYELNGSLVNGWKYTNGKITASIAPKIVLDGEEESTAIKSRGWVEECYTDYIYEPNWTCSEDVDVSYDEEYGDYVVTPECWEDGDWVETEVCYGYWEDDDNNYDDDSFVGGSGTSGGGNTSGGNEDNGGNENVYKELPNYNSISDKFSVVAQMSSPDVYKLIGGKVYENYLSNPEAFANACALRLSYALNMSGEDFKILFSEGKTGSGDADGNGIKEWYYYRVTDMVDYLNANYGEFEIVTMQNIEGRKGIIGYSDCNWSDASGHLDIWNGEDCLSNDYSDDCDTIYFWEIK